jgi:hypothetical protein
VGEGAACWGWGRILIGQQGGSSHDDLARSLEQRTMKGRLHRRACRIQPARRTFGFVKGRRLSRHHTHTRLPPPPPLLTQVAPARGSFSRFRGMEDGAGSPLLQPPAWGSTPEGGGGEPPAGAPLICLGDALHLHVDVANNLPQVGRTGRRGGCWRMRQGGRRRRGHSCAARCAAPPRAGVHT